jgi:hypothetical protein
VHNASYFASYYIKCLFISELKERDESFWEKSLGFVFVEMLYTLYSALRNRQIIWHYDPKINLLDRCDDRQITDAINFIGGVIKKIEKCCTNNTPENIYKIIMAKELKSAPETTSASYQKVALDSPTRNGWLYLF